MTEVNEKLLKRLEQRFELEFQALKEDVARSAPESSNEIEQMFRKPSRDAIANYHDRINSLSQYFSQAAKDSGTQRAEALLEFAFEGFLIAIRNLRKVYSS